MVHCLIELKMCWSNLIVIVYQLMLVDIYTSQANLLIHIVIISFVKVFISVGMATRMQLISRVWLPTMQKQVYPLKLFGQILITWMPIKISHLILSTFHWIRWEHLLILFTKMVRNMCLSWILVPNSDSMQFLSTKTSYFLLFMEASCISYWFEENFANRYQCK